MNKNLVIPSKNKPSTLWQRYISFSKMAIGILLVMLVALGIYAGAVVAPSAFTRSIPGFSQKQTVGCSLVKTNIQLLQEKSNNCDTKTSTIVGISGLYTIKIVVVSYPFEEYDVEPITVVSRVKKSDFDEVKVAGRQALISTQGGVGRSDSRVTDAQGNETIFAVFSSTKAASKTEYQVFQVEDDGVSIRNWLKVGDNAVFVSYEGSDLIPGNNIWSILKNHLSEVVGSLE